VAKRRIVINWAWHLPLPTCHAALCVDHIARSISALTCRNTELQKRRTSIAYDRWSHVWDLARYTNYSIYQSALASLDGQHRRVVDVGCGTGLMSAKLAAAGRQVLGVDLSSSMISRAARVRGNARLDFLQGDAENLPLEDAGFDAVVNLISFHHYPNPDKAIAEFRRVLRPGGRLVLIGFDLDSYFIQLAQRANQWTRNIAGDAWQKHGEEVAALVRNSGFASVELKPVRYWFKTFLIVADTAPEP
jgi:ubiquinone/menaquinone biosynthesis C-methylase UbiE